MALSKIGTLGIADDAITTDLVANNAITTAMIASGEVGVTDLGAGVVTDAKVSASAAIANSKLNLASIAQSPTFTGSVSVDTINNASGNMTIASTNNILLKFDSDNNQTNRELNVQSNAGDQILRITEVGLSEFSGNVNIVNSATLSVASNVVVDASRRFYPANIQNNSVISFLDGSNGTSGSGAQGINVRHIYAGTGYASASAGAGQIEAANGFKVAGTDLVNSTRDLINVTSYTGGRQLINGSSNLFGGSSVQGFLQDYIVDTGAGYSRLYSYHAGGGNFQFLVNAASTTTSNIALSINSAGNITASGIMAVNKALNGAVALSVGADTTATTSYGLEVTNASANTRFLVNGLGDSLFYRTDNAVGMKFDSTHGNLEVTNVNGSNGTLTSQYGIIAVSSGNAQATIGAHHNGDGYANLNLGSTVGGVRNMWHISKRLSSLDNILEFFYYDANGFNSKFQMGTSGSFLAVDQITSNKGVHATSVNHVDNGLIVKPGSSDTAASRGRFTNNAADIAIGRNIATFPGTWTKADNSVASGGWVIGTSGAAAFYQSAAGGTTPLQYQRLRLSENGTVIVGTTTTELNVLGTTSPNLQIGNGTNHAALQMYSGAGQVGAIYFGDSASGIDRYDGYIEYRHNNLEMAFRAAATTALNLKANELQYPAKQSWISDAGVQRFTLSKTIGPSGNDPILTFTKTSYAHYLAGTLVIILIDGSSPWGVLYRRYGFFGRTSTFTAGNTMGVALTLEQEHKNLDYTPNFATVDTRTSGQNGGTFVLNMNTANNGSATVRVIFDGYMAGGSFT